MIHLSGVRTRVFVCKGDVVVNKRRRRGIPVWWGKRLTRARYIRRCRCNRSTPIWRCSCERRGGFQRDNGVALNGAHRSAPVFRYRRSLSSDRRKKYVAWLLEKLETSGTCLATDTITNSTDLFALMLLSTFFVSKLRDVTSWRKEKNIIFNANRCLTILFIIMQYIFLKWKDRVAAQEFLRGI